MDGRLQGAVEGAEGEETDIGSGDSLEAALPGKAKLTLTPGRAQGQDRCLTYLTTGSVMNCMFVFLQNVYVEILPPKVMVIGGGTLER